MKPYAIWLDRRTARRIAGPAVAALLAGFLTLLILIVGSCASGPPPAPGEEPSPTPAPVWRAP